MPKQRTKRCSTMRYSPIRARTKRAAIKKWWKLHEKDDLIGVVCVKKQKIPKVRGMSLYSIGYTYR